MSKVISTIQETLQIIWRDLFFIRCNYLKNGYICFQKWMSFTGNEHIRINGYDFMVQTNKRSLTGQQPDKTHAALMRKSGCHFLSLPAKIGSYYFIIYRNQPRDKWTLLAVDQTHFSVININSRKFGETCIKSGPQIFQLPSESRAIDSNLHQWDLDTD